VTSYTVLVSREDDAYIVDVPALPGCHTYGHTLEEALANAREAIQVYLDDVIESGEALPVDTAPQAIRLDLEQPAA
jgi:antitoxin HicB